MVPSSQQNYDWEAPVEESLSTYLIAFYFQTLLYGIYVVLFAMAIYLLAKNHTTAHRILIVVGISMFALATGDIGLTHYYLFRKLLQGNDPVLRLKHIYAKIFLYVISNVIADGFLIHRCYTVWGRRKWILMVPMILLLASAAITLQGITSPRLQEYAKIYLWLTFAINTLVTVLIATRIWSITRELGRRLAPEQVNKYRYATAIVIETGVLYSMYVLVSVLVKSVIPINSLIQVVGIVPTIVIVQVGLDRHTRSVDETIESVNATIATAQRQIREMTMTEETSNREVICLD